MTQVIAFNCIQSKTLQYLLDFDGK